MKINYLTHYERVVGFKQGANVIFLLLYTNLLQKFIQKGVPGMGYMYLAECSMNFTLILDAVYHKITQEVF